MSSTVSLSDPLQGLQDRFLGSLLQPDHDDYDTVRRVYNGLIDRRPAVIAGCTGTGDVVDALAFAREHGLEVSVRGGGHSVAGRAVCDGGLMIDLSGMKGIHVDPARRTARAQGGVTWAEFNRETQVFGLATTGGVISSTGIAGLTLGGGLGYLMGKHGMTVDNLLSAEVVLADGRVVTASEDSEPDLFWGIRGGGGNFGVVTSFEYRLHPVTTVTGGLIAYPFNRAGEVLRFYRELTRDLPDEVVLFGGVVWAPDGSGNKLAAIIACDCTPPEEGHSRVIDRIKGFGSPVMDVIGPIGYAPMNTILDGSFPKGALNYWKSSFLEELTDDAIDTMVEGFAGSHSQMDGVLMEHFHGAVARRPVEATAFPHRSPGYNLGVFGVWKDPADTDRCIAWARDTYGAMEPHLRSDRYVNYMGDDESDEQVALAFGPNLPRLQAVKAKYDPENVFHLNHNITPASEGIPA